MNSKILNFYASPGKFTNLGKYAKLQSIPSDLHEMVSMLQGNLIHEFAALPFYGVDATKEKREESHIRYAKSMVEKILNEDSGSIDKKKKPEERLMGVCHHYSLLLTALLRSKKIPARVRYGFGSYFHEGYFEDHSICETWDSATQSWKLVDAQFDSIWQKQLKIRHDIFQVPREKFLTPGLAWIKCRRGELDPERFGIFQGDLRGLWFLAGNIIKDIAALNKMELLQWDAWGAMPRPNNQMKDQKKLKFFDELAELSNHPDENFQEVKEVYDDKSKRIFIPERVFNAVKRHLENV